MPYLFQRQISKIDYSVTNPFFEFCVLREPFQNADKIAHTGQLTNPNFRCVIVSKSP
jgi:hypothetical protein